MTTPNRVHLEHSTPIFRVSDMGRSLRFYEQKLGFENAEWGSDDFTCITRGGASIYLCQGDQGRGGAWAWIGVEDARRLHEELKAASVESLTEPANFDWAVEFQVEDPDNNVIRFGSDPGEI